MYYFHLFQIFSLLTFAFIIAIRVIFSSAIVSSISVLIIFTSLIWFYWNAVTLNSNFQKGSEVLEIFLWSFLTS